MILDICEELVAIPLKDEQEEIAFLSACFKFAGSLTITSGGVGIEIISNDYKVAFLIANLLKKYLKKDVQLQTKNQEIGKRKINNFLLNVSGNGVIELLSRCNVLNVKEDGEAFVDSTQKVAGNIELLRVYMRALLILKGKISIPEVEKNHITADHSNAYRIEMKKISEKIAQEIANRMAELDIILKIKSQSDSTTLSSTDSSVITDLLAFVGANKAVLMINSSIIARSFKSKVVREMNCNMANIDKVISAGEKLMSAVAKLKLLGKYHELDKATQDTCNKKINNMELSLEQIANELNISKSAVNHRIRKVIELANSL